MTKEELEDKIVLCPRCDKIQRFVFDSSWGGHLSYKCVECNLEVLETYIQAQLATEQNKRMQKGYLLF